MPIINSVYIMANCTHDENEARHGWEADSEERAERGDEGLDGGVGETQERVDGERARESGCVREDLRRERTRHLQTRHSCKIYKYMYMYV